MGKLKLKEKKVKVYKATVPLTVILFLVSLGFSISGLYYDNMLWKDIAILTLLSGFTVLLIDVAT